MQNHHSLLYREEEREMLPLLKVSPCQLPRGNARCKLIFTLDHQHLGVGCIPWSPLARGVLSRPWDEASVRSKTDE